MGSSSTIHGRFAEQVGRTPDAVAVSSGDVRLTYRELDERSNQMAHRLLALGAGPEIPVAVLMERSVDRVRARVDPSGRFRGDIAPNASAFR
ncbi:AMP-binding protein [Streptosporangium canum]|uniref:AMP-binding protein n=1 Tax=Streptosporangium canum TaxID=324952 RepID=UPI0033B5EF3A